MKKFRCLVCGYLHEGDTPPDICPICGADRSQFVEVVDEPPPGPERVPPVASPPSASVRHIPPEPRHSAATVPLLARLVLKHHLHPILVHFPNGLIPTSIVFLILALLLSKEVLAAAAFLNLGFVLLCYPAVILSGLAEWRFKYQSATTTLFLAKIFSALALGGLLVAILAWKIVQGDVLAHPGVPRAIYLALHLAALLCAGIAGHMGGKLVFKD